MTEKIIRDFIYVNGDKVNSFYSQLKEGLVQQIVDARLDSKTKENKENSFTKATQFATQLNEEKNTSESKILHDYTYVELEKLLRNAIITPTKLTEANYAEDLNRIFLLKVSGIAEISDYSRIKEILGEFNSFIEGINYLSEANAIGGNPQAAKFLFENTKGANHKDNLQFLKRFENPKRMAQEARVLQDEKSLKYIEQFMNLFYPDGIEITIVSTESEKEIAYRGYIDKQWLRLNTSDLKHLYAGLTQNNWTMVGQITHIPDFRAIDPKLLNNQAEKNIEEVSKNIKELKANPTPTQDSVRAGFTKVIEMTRSLEAEFARNTARTEIVVLPLAIYRETTIQIEETH